MKKIICILIMVLCLNVVAFGDMIDEGYIGLIFDNFDKYDEATKLENAELLDVFFATDFSLDILYTTLISTKKASLDAYGVSEGDLRRNIDALKTWSVEDRKALIAAGVSGNQALVIDINNRNVKKEEILGSAFITSAKPIKAEYKKNFKDMDGHWSKSSVNFLTERDIIRGKSDVAFEPDANILKSEIVSMVVGLVVEDAKALPAYTGKVADIQTGAWYDTTMQHAYALNIIEEDLNKKLNPTKFASREEVVDILVNTISSLNIDLNEDLKAYKGDYSDYSNLSPSYRESMVIAINLGLINGKTQDTIAPNAFITRGETAAVVKRLYDFIIKEL